MTFKEGDYVLSDGKICRVRYANDDIVVYMRVSDCHLMADTPERLAREQEPWVLRPQGWWSPMSIVLSH